MCVRFSLKVAPKSMSLHAPAKHLRVHQRVLNSEKHQRPHLEIDCGAIFSTVLKGISIGPFVCVCVCVCVLCGAIT